MELLPPASVARKAKPQATALGRAAARKAEKSTGSKGATPVGTKKAVPKATRAAAAKRSIAGVRQQVDSIDWDGETYKATSLQHQIAHSASLTAILVS